MSPTFWEQILLAAGVALDHEPEAEVRGAVTALQQEYEAANGDPQAVAAVLRQAFLVAGFFAGRQVGRKEGLRARPAETATIH